MKTLTVAALLCAVMALTTAADLSEVTEIPETMEEPQEGEHHVVKRSTSCPGGWRMINGRCFRYIPRKLTWAQAERNCQSLGANLASVHRADEYHDIRRMVADQTHEHPVAWIGGSDSAVDGVWLWIDGTPFIFSYWCKGEPSNYGRYQHCLVINDGDGKCWDDQWCRYRFPSVCAKKP